MSSELRSTLKPSTDPGPSGLHVVLSELAIAPEGSEMLEAAFRDRLGEVDAFEGHRGLQVWRDERHAGRYFMVTWWDTPDAFKHYMRSQSHHDSHARMPMSPVRPHPVHVDQLTVVSR